MLNIYQRKGEKVRPSLFYSTNLKRGPDVDLIMQDDAETLEAVEIEISNDETATIFYTAIGAPPVFVSLRPGKSPNIDNMPEIVLCVPDDEPGIYAEQYSAALLESAYAAVESADLQYREALRWQFGLSNLVHDSAGPRALRPAMAQPLQPVSVKMRFADGQQDEFTLSEKCPAIFLDPTENAVALALSPVIWAADLLYAVAETWKG